MTALFTRPATAADVARFYPDISASVRAWVCEVDGEPQGIIGIAYSRPVHSVFSVFTDRLRPHLRSLTILRLIRGLLTYIERCRAPVMAIREPSERTAPHILKKLGFRFWQLVDGDAVYRWEGR